MSPASATRFRHIHATYFIVLATDLLWKCIHAADKGQVWANSVQLQLLLSTLRKTPPVRVLLSPGTNFLTQRETQVASLVAEGFQTKEIGQKLGITEHTVSNNLIRAIVTIFQCKPLTGDRFLVPLMSPGAVRIHAGGFF